MKAIIGHSSGINMSMMSMMDMLMISIGRNYLGLVAVVVILTGSLSGIF